MEGVNGILLGQDGKTGWAVGVVALLVGIMVYWKSFAETRKLKGRPPVPPGSCGWPFLGETLEFLRYGRANNLEEFFRIRVAKYGETFKTHIFFKPTVSVGAPDGNKFLFANENKLVQNTWPAPVAKLLGDHSLGNKVGDEHKRARRIYAKFFNPEGLQSFVPRIDALARVHIAKYWEGKDSILGMPTMKMFTFAVAADLFLSMKDDDPRFQPLETATEEFLAGVFQIPIDLPGAAYHRGRLGREAMLRIIDTCITQKRQEDQGSAHKDLLSVLMNSPDENGTSMSDDEMKDNILLMMFAGHETTSTTLTIMLKYLHLNPECLKEVLREQREIAKVKDGAPLDWGDTRRMKYTWRVCQETLRIQPPVQASFRKAIQDFEYGGFTIPKGWIVFWSVGRSNKAPEFYPNPEKFDPSRFEDSGPAPYVFTPFGGGPHICLGNEFARMEMLVFLHHIVLNFNWKMVDPNEPISIIAMPLFKNGLELKISRRDDDDDDSVAL